MTTTLSEPVFIIGAPRSGTTLLRLILNAHPEIACPGETNLPTLAANLEHVWSVIGNDLAGAPVPPSSAAIRGVRNALRAPMRHYCQETGKRIYCDKSLDAPDNLAVLHRAFPRARYILLFRQAFDVVSSGLDASPFGFDAFGYGQFIQNSTDNFVAPLILQWKQRARAALDWEAAHSERCHRLRYEDLVTNTESCVSALFDFLEVKRDLSTIRRALKAAPDAVSPGDAKIGFATEVYASSIGRGRRVPVSKVPPLLLAEVNELLAMLGYERVSDTWNATQSAPRARRGSLRADLRRLQRLMPHTVDGSHLARRHGGYAIVVENLAGVAWKVDCKTGAVAVDPDAVAETTLYGSVSALFEMLIGAENPATLFRDGRLRVGGETGDGWRRAQRDVTLLIRALHAAAAG